MSFSFLRAPAPLIAALTSILVASLAVSACGQEGIVAATSGTTSTDTGGSGGTGGAGGTGTAGTIGTGGAETPMPLKVLNWNLHNFFNTTKDTSFENEFVLNGTEYAQKLAAVGKILNELQPDVAILPEVENEGILNELNKTQLGNAYTVAVPETNDFRGLDIGVLTKLPIVDLVSHKDDSFKRLDLAGGPAYKYSRDALEIHFNYNGREVILLGVHYRSKGTGSAETDDKDKRMAEAQHTRAIADALMKENPKRAIVILGDYNDLPGSPPVNWTLQGDPKNSPKVVFESATDAISQDLRYTFVYNGTKELIDHQIANPLLGGMIDPQNVMIRHGNDVEDASDHFPLMTTYNIQ
ncbi:MAG: endonuclease/exonuclease/phosphatase family protein [Polyangiaceae bacterium]|nr:endonuclease/exonuclease/phosphatase family protein [Polyangiaceae bacterium]